MAQTAIVSEGTGITNEVSITLAGPCPPNVVATNVKLQQTQTVFLQYATIPSGCTTLGTGIPLMICNFGNMVPGQQVNQNFVARCTQTCEQPQQDMITVFVMSDNVFGTTTETTGSCRT